MSAAVHRAQWPRVREHRGHGPVPGAERVTVEPGYVHRLANGRWLIAYINRDQDGDHEIGVLIQGQREHLRWCSGFHELGQRFCVGTAHFVAHLETHYDATGRVVAVVLDVN